jgi:hypothetical protein
MVIYMFHFFYLFANRINLIMSLCRPQQNMQIMAHFCRSSNQHGNEVLPVNSVQVQPQLDLQLHRFPQTLQHNFTPSGSGKNIFHDCDMVLSFPFYLLKFFNPKVLEVIKHWS